MPKMLDNKELSTGLIHQLIEKNALSHPTKIAVAYQDKNLSYEELNQKSNYLANLLITEGIKPETIVGVSFERSPEMVIAILGVLKSGGAYLPIDPSYPQDRINYMLSDSNISFLLTQKTLLKKFQKIKLKKICLDSTQINQTPINPQTTVNKDNLAYVLYTSGSTGNPKGVMVCHSNLINTYESWEKVYQLKDTDCHLQMANFSFDVFTGDLARALCSGGKLILCPKRTLLNPKKLYELITKEKINCAEFVPTILRKLYDYLNLNNHSLAFMRLLICGSDNWSINEYRKLQKLCGKKTRVINSYGLTETTIDSTYFEDPLPSIKYFSTDRSVPIGKPFPNTEIFILDDNLNTMPNDIIGEICIAGHGLARGYLNNPQLTAQKFIFHPSLKKRLYKTGDLGRRLSDGNIEFLGRLDNQIKLRGMRVELNDVENILNSHPSIKESLTAVCENQVNNKKLIAYFVPKQGAELNTLELRKFLQTKLPNYMIPSIFIKLDSLPITPSGKLDRKALNHNSVFIL